MDAAYWPSASASSSSSTSTQVDEQLSPELTDLIHTNRVAPVFVDYLVDTITDAVECGLGSSHASVCVSRMRSARTHPSHERKQFTDFVAKILRRAEVSMSVVLGTLVYIDRARPHLRIAIEQWAPHRVFLGALICASKYLNDASLKNAHWALCTSLFGKRDVARIEREFLEVLDFALAVRAPDLADVYARMARARVVRPASAVEVSSTFEGKSTIEGKSAFENKSIFENKGRAEKRRSVDVDVDSVLEESEHAREKGRKGRRMAIDLFVPRAPAPSPISPYTDAESPLSACSNSSVGSNSSASTSSSPDSGSGSSCTSSPRTPPVSHLDFPHVPHTHVFPSPYAPMDSKPSPYVPKPTARLHLSSAAAPPALPALPPFPALALALPTSFSPYPALPAPALSPPPAFRSLPASRSASPYAHAPLSYPHSHTHAHPHARSRGNAMALYPSCLGSVAPHTARLVGPARV